MSYICVAFIIIVETFLLGFLIYLSSQCLLPICFNLVHVRIVSICQSITMEGDCTPIY